MEPTPEDTSPAVALTPDGPMVGQLLASPPPGWLRGTRQVEGVEWRELAPPMRAGREDVRVWIREAALHAFERGEQSIASPPALREVTGHVVLLETDDGRPVAEARCAPLEVLREGERPLVRLRSRDGRLALHAYAPGPLAERGEGDCPPRVVQWPRVVIARVSPLPGGRTEIVAEPPDPIPEGYRERRTLPDPLPMPRHLWWIRRVVPAGTDEAPRPMCQRFRVQRNASGFRLTTRERYEVEGGVAETVRQYSFEGTGPQLMAYAPSSRTRWIRRPRGLHIGLGSAGAAGCVNPTTIVDEDDERFTYVAAERVRAYHPDDAGHWYKSANACERDLAAAAIPP